MSRPRLTGLAVGSLPILLFVCIVFPLMLSPGGGWASNNVFVTLSGETYVFDQSNFVWTVTDSTDTLLVDTTRVVVQIPQDSTLTESDLDSAGFSRTDILASGLFGNYYILSFPAGSTVEAYLDSLESWSIILETGYDIKMEYYSGSSDTYFGEQWGFADDLTRGSIGLGYPFDRIPSSGSRG